MMSFRPRNAGLLVRRTESRKPVTTEPVGVGRPPNALGRCGKTSNVTTALLWSYGRSTNELGGYWFPALGPPDESGGPRPG